MKHYSPSTKGFYTEEIHGDNIPSDCIAISDEEHQHLIENESDTDCIGVKDGKVVLIERVKTQEEIDNRYKILRSASYPDFREYLDGVVKGDQEQIQTYIDACLAVKNKYPKP
jgi:hypothetical protein